jgi:hypothetical protein
VDDEWSADLGMKTLSGQLLDWQIVLKGKASELSDLNMV